METDKHVQYFWEALASFSQVRAIDNHTVLQNVAVVGGAKKIH